MLVKYLNDIVYFTLNIIMYKLFYHCTEVTRFKSKIDQIVCAQASVKMLANLLN